jgi:uncharacterized protein YbjT (DUF2867 family)
VRVSAREPRSGDFPAAVSVVAADLTKPDTVRAALDGVRKVFLYAPVTSVHDFVAAASEAALEHIALLSSGSVLLPDTVGNPLTEEHRSVEQALADSGLSWTPIRPLVLAANALGWADSIRTEGVVRLLHPEAMTAPVHERDVAAVAVAVLLRRAGEQASAMLTGCERLSQRRQAELIGAATGRDLRIEELSESEARAQFGQSADTSTVDSIIQFLASAANGGSPATDAVQQVLGKPALPFAEWAREHVLDFR